MSIDSVDIVFDAPFGDAILNMIMAFEFSTA